MSVKDELLGSTGRFPQGKLNPSDQGELKFKVGRDQDGNVWIDFGNVPVTWMAFQPEGAINFARLLLQHAGATKIIIET